MNGSELPLHWDPLTANVEVWTGQNLDRLQFIANSLSEVGIPSRSLTDTPQWLRLLVRPEDEANAREVVRQIVEGAVPERSISRGDDDIWHDEPVRSYVFAWLPTVIYGALVLLVNMAYASPGQILTESTPLTPLFSFIRGAIKSWRCGWSIRPFATRFSLGDSFFFPFCRFHTCGTTTSDTRAVAVTGIFPSSCASGWRNVLPLDGGSPASALRLPRGKKAAASKCRHPFALL